MNTLQRNRRPEYQNGKEIYCPILLIIDSAGHESLHYAAGNVVTNGHGRAHIEHENDDSSDDDEIIHHTRTNLRAS
jgi:hypothetical protein